MKITIDYIIQNLDSVAIEDIFNFIESTKDVFMLKYDGVRLDKKYTVIILGQNSQFEPIRYEVDILKDGIRNALNDYRGYVSNAKLFE